MEETPLGTNQNGAFRARHLTQTVGRRTHESLGSWTTISSEDICSNNFVNGSKVDGRINMLRQQGHSQFQFLGVAVNIIRGVDVQQCST
jgi:hypothetical protein